MSAGKEFQTHGIEANLGHIAFPKSIQKTLTPTTETLTGGRTVTWAEMQGGLLLFDPDGARTVTLPTAALIRAGLIKREVGSSIKFWIKNTSLVAGEIMTLAAGSGMTLNPTVIKVNPGEVVEILLTLDIVAVGSEAVTAYLINTYNPASEAQGAIDDFVTVTATATAGAHEHTATEITGGFIQRDPAGADRADTFDAAADIISAMLNSIVGDVFYFFIENTADAYELVTLTAGGVGVTLDPTTVVIKPGQIVRFMARKTAAATVTIYKIGEYEPDQYMVVDSESGDAQVWSAAEMLGGFIQHDPAGTAAATVDTDTAANIIAAMEHGGINTFFDFFVENTADAFETLTLSGGADVTLDPTTVVIYPGQIVHFRCHVTSGTDVTVYELSRNKQVESGFYQVNLPIAPASIDIKAQIDPIVDFGPSAPVDQPDYPRRVQVVVVELAVSAGILRLIGLDANGISVTETMDIGVLGTGTHLSNNAFADLVSIELSGTVGAAPGDTIEAGWADYYGLPTRPGAMLIGTHKVNEDQDDAVPGVIVEEYGTVDLPSAANGLKNFSFWYTYV